MNDSTNQKERIKAIVVDDDEDSSDSISQALEIGGINVIGKAMMGSKLINYTKPWIQMF